MRAGSDAKAGTVNDPQASRGAPVSQGAQERLGDAGGARGPGRPEGWSEAAESANASLRRGVAELGAGASPRPQGWPRPGRREARRGGRSCHRLPSPGTAAPS